MKKTIYVVLAVACFAIAACSKNGDPGVNGKNGPAGAAGPAGDKGAPGDTGATGATGNANVSIQNIKIAHGQWKQNGQNGGTFDVTPTYAEGGIEIFLLNSDKSYLALPCALNATRFNMFYLYYPPAGTKNAYITIGAFDKDAKGNLPADTVTLKVITFPKTELGTVKQQAGGLDYNSLSKYYNFK